MMSQQTRYSGPAPKLKTMSCHHRTGSVLEVDLPLPGFIRSARTQEYRWLMLCSWQLTDRSGDKSQRRDDTAERFTPWMNEWASEYIVNRPVLVCVGIASVNGGAESSPGGRGQEGRRRLSIWSRHCSEDWRYVVSLHLQQHICLFRTQPRDYVVTSRPFFVSCDWLTSHNSGLSVLLVLPGDGPSGDHTHDTYVIFPNNIRMIRVRYFGIRWHHYVMKINCVCCLQPKFTKVSTECVINSRKRKQ